MKKRTSVSIVLILLGLLAAVGAVSWAKRHLICSLPLPKGKYVKLKYPAKYMVIDKTGKVVLETDKHLEGHFSEGLCPFSVEKNGGLLYGYLDLNGKVSINPQFNWASDFSDGIGVVAINRWQYGFIDEKGNLNRIFWPWELSYCGAFEDGEASASRYTWEGKTESGVVDRNGNFKSRTWKRKDSPLYARDFEGLWGYVNSDGKTIIPGKYLYAEHIFFDGLASCAVDLSTTPKPGLRYYSEYDCGKLALVPMRSISPESPTVSGILVNLKFGLIDQSGNWVLKPKYDSILYARNGMRMVEKNGKFGFISSKGVEVIPPIYKDAIHFGADYAVVSSEQLPNYCSSSFPDGIHYPDCKDGVIPFDSLMNRKDVEAALSVCDEIIKLKPQCATIYGEQAGLLTSKGQLKEALSACDKGLSFEPERLDLLVKRGLLFHRLKRWSEAERDFSKYIQFHESRGDGDTIPFVYQRRGLARLRQNKFMEAKEDIFVLSARSILFHPKGEMTPAIELEGISREEAAEVFEKLGDEKNAERVMLEAKESRTRTRTRIEPEMCEVDLESVLSKTWAKRKGELENALSAMGTSQYCKLKARLLAIEAIEKLIAAKEIEFKVDDVQSLLELDIELLSKVPQKSNDSERYIVQPQSALEKAQSKLKESFSQSHDARGGSKERLETTNRNLANDISVVNISKYPGAGLSFSGCSRPILPNVSGKETADQNFEIAKRCASLGMTNSAWEFVRLAKIGAKTQNESKKLENFCRTRLSPDGIKMESMELYHKTLCAQECSYAYMEQPAISMRELNLRRALELSPNFTAAHVALAKEYRNQYRLKLAERDLVQAEKINPDFLELWIERGRLAELKGDNKGAKIAYTRAFELDPENQLAHRLLVNLTSSERN